MQEFLEEEKQEPLKGKWLASSGVDDFLQTMTRQSRLYVELYHADGVLNRKTAEIACVQGDAGDAILIDLKNESLARCWRRLAEDGSVRTVCWDSKLYLLSQENRGIRVARIPDDVMLMAFLVAPNAGDYSLKHWALDQLHVSLDDEKSNRQGSLLPEPEKIVESLCRRLESVRSLYAAAELPPRSTPTAEALRGNRAPLGAGACGYGTRGDQGGSRDAAADVGSNGKAAGGSYRQDLPGSRNGVQHQFTQAAWERFFSRSSTCRQ